MYSNKRWDEKDIEILKKYYGKIKIEELRKLLPNVKIKNGSISKYAAKFGLHHNGQRLAQRKYSYNDKYFDTPTVENCYWAGYIAADGCIGRKKDGSDIYLKLSLSSKDDYLLDIFSSHINSTYPIKKQTTKWWSEKSKSYSYYSCLALWCAENLHYSLNKHWNITQNKSLTLIPPKEYIKNELAYAFLIGLFDGDGWITKITRKSGKEYFSWGVCGTYDMMLWVKDVCNELINEPNNTNVTKNNSIYRYIISGRNAVKLAQTLNMVVNIPWKMRRKWENCMALVAT